jgi:ABC-type Mn2+/Zn2+ transport system ATPase subunit
MGTSTEADIQTQDLQEIVAVIESTGVPAVFAENIVNPKMMNQLARDHGVVLGGSLFTDSLGEEGSGAETYVKMLLKNAETIHAGLTSATQTGGYTRFNWPFALGMLTFFGLALGFVLLRLRNTKSIVPTKPIHISIQNLSVAYENKAVLRKLSLNLSGGKVYGLIGPNGSGKSTLVKSLLGFVPKQQGEISVNGNPISAYATLTAYVPQREEIDWDFPATVLDTVLMGRYPHKGVFERISKADKTAAINALEKVGISHLADRQIGALSGGQQQRTFLARSLAQEAEVYLLDEPFVGVDAATEAKIVDLLRELAAQGKFVLIIHHDLSKLEAYFDEVILLGEQKLLDVGPTTQVVNRQASLQSFKSVSLAK